MEYCDAMSENNVNTDTTEIPVSIPKQQPAPRGNGMQSNPNNEKSTAEGQKERQKTIRTVVIGVVVVISLLIVAWIVTGVFLQGGTSTTTIVEKEVVTTEVPASPSTQENTSENLPEVTISPETEEGLRKAGRIAAETSKKLGEGLVNITEWSLGKVRESGVLGQSG